MAQLTSEERIARVEQAPKEMQTMVAKAFLRDDIDDENVQYLFNEDSVEEMNDEDTIIENLGAEEPDGIGSSHFEMRTAKPKAGNKNYIVKGSGGWNTCIKGKPMDAACNALANCVGYASGRFNEIINEARGQEGCTYKTLNCNAVGFKERAEKAGLKTSSTPKVGAIICWGKNNNGAGHVAIIEKINADGSLYTSESGYNCSKIFWNSTRTNKNGRWGMNANYYFRCFIYLPQDVQDFVDGKEPTPTPPTPVPPTPTPKLKVGDKVKIIGTGNGSSYGTINKAYGLGWTREILKIYSGRPYPYRVGNKTGTTGFYKESALKKL